MSRYLYLMFEYLGIFIILLLSSPLYIFGEEKEPVEDTQEEQMDRKIAQEEPAYQKDVPMEEEEAAPQAPHDMDDSHLLSKSKK